LSDVLENAYGRKHKSSEERSQYKRQLDLEKARIRENNYRIKEMEKLEQELFERQVLGVIWQAK
jgi:hypothetical protein